MNVLFQAPGPYLRLRVCPDNHCGQGCETVEQSCVAACAVVLYSYQVTCGYGCINVAAAIQWIKHHCVATAAATAGAGAAAWNCCIVFFTCQHHHLAV